MSDKNKRIYRAPLGATSITVNGNTYEVDAKGNLECNDDAAHADLLSHGYTYGDDAAADDHVPDRIDGRELAAWQKELDERVVVLREREADLDERHAALNARAAELEDQAATLAAYRTDLANKETDLTIRTHQLEQREAALAAAVPPPPPEAPAVKSKGKA
jgi:hypothetical protein